MFFLTKRQCCLLVEDGKRVSVGGLVLSNPRDRY